MLEFLIFALFSEKSENFLAAQNFEKSQKIILKNFWPEKIPQKNPEKIAPKLLENPRTAILAVDTNSGKILFEKNSARPQKIASLSKILTALIILENHEIDEIVQISPAATKILGAQIGILAHEKMTIGTLLEAALIASANDAAVALAIFDAGSEKKFVEKMNARAAQLQLNSAKFFNSTGLDFFDKKEKKFLGNEMSAADVLKLTRIALQKKFFRAAVAKNHFYGTSVDQKFFHEKPSTNQLLGTFLEIRGVKTGFTNSAGGCFVALSKKNDTEILTVILGSDDRFGETKNFLSWIFDAFLWK